MQFPRFKVPLQQSVDDRHEEKGKKRRHRQAPDHRASKWGILLST
jgi:hypothetical protein